MDDNNMGDKIKEGVSVQELENWGKKYGFEITFLVYFILASIFTFVFFGPHWSIYLAGIGGALGVWLPGRVEKFISGLFRFINKQEKPTRYIIAIVGAIISFFVPPLIFLMLGLAGGSNLYRTGTRRSGGE